MPAAVAGLQQDFLSDPYVATAYLLAAIIDATEGTDDLDNLHRGEVAMKAAISAMVLAGATNDETLATVEELVAMHRKSAEKLERAVLGE